MTAAGNSEMVAPLTGGSRVRFRELSERRDANGWVIGRIETGEFISVPDVAHRVITLLGEGDAVDEVAARLRQETGVSFAVADFVTALDELGFLAAIDGWVREDTACPQASLPWLQPRYVHWLLHPLAAIVVVGFAVAIVVMLALHPALIPSYRVLVWGRYAGLVLAVNAAIAWTIILLHELAHLATARAVGAPARMTLSTRLQFLAAQTDVSGVWPASRRTRMTVYLAGMSADVCNAGICLLILGLADPHGLVRRLLAVAVAEALILLTTQFMVFMRTDIYFVFQDLTGCANLYADGSAYLRYLGRRVTLHIKHVTRPNPDPSMTYPSAQRRAIRSYSLVLLVGTAICLAVEFAVTLPTLIVLMVRAVSEIGVTLVATVDGCAALVFLLAWHALWASRWWHRHQYQVRPIARQYLRGRKEVIRHG